MQQQPQGSPAGAIATMSVDQLRGLQVQLLKATHLKHHYPKSQCWPRVRARLLSL